MNERPGPLPDDEGTRDQEGSGTESPPSGPSQGGPGARAGEDAASDGEDAASDGGRQRRYAQLLRLQEEVMEGLQHMRAQIEAPAVRQIVRELRSEAGDAPAEWLSGVSKSLEDAHRAVRLSHAEVRRQLAPDRPREESEEVGALPGPLARFLDERRETPGFAYELHRDPIRGWIIRWKEHSPEGVIRGSGQFYERPYAWLDD